MLIPTLIMGLLALFVAALAYKKGEHLNGMKSALTMTLEIVPLLLFAFIVAGMAQVLLPKELPARWGGTESGLRGIFIGTLAGACAPGGPYVSLPIAAGLLRSGTSTGTMVAFLTGWPLWPLAGCPWK